MNDDKLFAQFPPVTTEEWESAIIKDLKGADYDKKLVWKTNEHINVRPYYRADDLKSITHLSDDGTFPYAKNNGSNWNVRQDFVIADDCDIKQLQRLVSLAVNNGVESVGYDFTKRTAPVGDELFLQLMKELKPATSVNLMCNTTNVMALFGLLKAYMKDMNVKSDSANFNIEYDPFFDFVSEGGSYMDGIDTLHNLIKESAEYPNMKVGVINASYFGNCGSFLVDELSFGLAEFADVLDFLTEAGETIDKIVPKLKLQVSIGSNYFFEIAKLRTARYIWGEMVNAYSPKNKDCCGVFIHAITSMWNKTLYDPYVNMLRTTTESMSSVIGGIDSLTVLPFNFVTMVNDEFALRIARNQQLLLKEESHFGNVTDPAAGSYYIESITEQFIENVWNKFLEINGKGGFIQCFKSNYIQDIITESCEKRDKAVATRRENFVGVNQYPNITETIDFDEVKKSCGCSDEEKEDTSCCECGDMAPKFRTLQPYRGTEPFERLRLQTELYTKESGHRPSVFLFTYGNLAMRIARAGFASNFFGCAGYKIINNNGFQTIEAGVEAAKQSKAEIVVICSSDEEYGNIAPEIYNGLKDSAIVVVAGNPVDCMDKLTAAGLQHFIHVRTNLLESLSNFQKLIIK